MPRPDLVLFLRVDSETVQQRLRERGGPVERNDDVAIQKAVAQGFELRFVNRIGTDVVVIDAALPAADVAAEAIRRINDTIARPHTKALRTYRAFKMPRSCAFAAALVLSVLVETLARLAHGMFLLIVFLWVEPLVWTARGAWNMAKQVWTDTETAISDILANAAMMAQFFNDLARHRVPHQE